MTTPHPPTATSRRPTLRRPRSTRPTPRRPAARPPVLRPTAPQPGRTLGIVAFVLSFFAQLIGLILGIVALVQSKRAGQKNGWAVAAIIISSVLMVIGIIFGSGCSRCSCRRPRSVTQEILEQCRELGTRHPGDQRRDDRLLPDTALNEADDDGGRRAPAVAVRGVSPGCGSGS